MWIYDLIPDAEVLLGLAPEEVAFSLLRIADASLQNGMVLRDQLTATEASLHSSDHRYRPREEEGIGRIKCIVRWRKAGRGGVTDAAHDRWTRYFGG